MRPCSFGCAVFATIFCASWQSAASAQDWLSRAIPAEHRSHDFGTVARSARTEHRFTINNVSERELHIRSVRASCGCTTPIVETETIPPGESGTILARFNTGTFTGQKKATLTVTIDRPFFTELQLNVQGYIRSDVVLHPGEIEFGQVPEGDSKVTKVTLDYAGRSDWKIERIESPLGFVQAQFEEVSRSNGRIQYKITAEVDPKAPVGFLQNHFILHTNDRRLKTVPVLFNGTIQPAIQFSPQNLSLGRVKPGEPISQRLVIKGRQPFRILDIRSDVAEIRFDPTDQAKSAHLLNIVVAPKRQQTEKKVQSHVLLYTDLDDTPLKLGLSFEIATQSRPPDTVQAAK